MYKKMIKELAAAKMAMMKKTAIEEEQIAPFRAGNIKMTELLLFSSAVQRVLGGLNKNVTFTNNIMPTAASYVNYQGVLFSTRSPQFFSDISQFASKKFEYGLKDFDITEPFEFESEEHKKKLGLEDKPDEIPCRTTCGWFKDDKTKEWKLLVLLPNPKSIFNRVAKLPNPKYDPKDPSQGPAFFVKTIMDHYTKYSYDFPLKFGQTLFEMTYMEYGLFYLDKFVVENLKLTKDAGASGFKRHRSGVNIREVIDAYQEAPIGPDGKPDQTYSPHRPALISRNNRDAVDLYTPKDEKPSASNINHAWKTMIFTRKPGLKEAVPAAPVEDDPLAVLTSNSEEKKPKTVDNSGKLSIDKMEDAKVYRVSELNNSTRLQNGMQKLLDEDDSRTANSWTMNDYAAPAISWEAGDQRQPTKSAAFGVTFRFPKPFSMEGVADIGSAGGLQLDFEFDRMHNVENGYEGYLMIKDYVETVDSARITGIESVQGKEQREIGEHKRVENSLAKFNKKKIEDMNKEIDTLIETNLKYRNDNYSKNRPVLGDNGILKYMADLELYIRRLKAQTPKTLTEVNNILEMPRGSAKLKRGDLNLLRIIFDEIQ